MLRPVRRIVTGHNAEGKAVVLIDDVTPHTLEHPFVEGRGLSDIWRTFEAPPTNTGDADAADTTVTLLPPRRGSVFRFFQVMPKRLQEGLSPEERMRQDRALFELYGAAAQHDATSGQVGMHRTQTVDYIILLAGRVTLILDEGEVDLEPFDTVVQRGTNHAWENRGDEPAVLAGVLIDAVPLER